MNALLVTLLPLLLGPPSEAESTPSEPGLVFADTVPERERKTIADEFALALPVACEPVPCVSECGADERTLSLRLSGEDRMYVLSFAVRDPALPDPIVAATTCELCSTGEVVAQMRAELARVCQRVAVLDQEPAREPMLESEVNETTYRAPVMRQRPAWPGWLGLGAGLALGLVGATLIAIDEAPYRRDCSGANLDALGNCRYRLATAPLGIGLAIVGGVALGTGIGLTVWAHPSGRSGAETRAGVSLTWRF
jgi:hypothetical protein